MCELWLAHVTLVLFIYYLQPTIGGSGTRNGELGPNRPTKNINITPGRTGGIGLADLH